MFDLPDAKRVRREDLRPSPESSSPDPELTALLHSHFSHVYGDLLTETLSEHQIVPTGTHVEQHSAPQDAQTSFEFCLFAAPPVRRAAASADCDHNGIAAEPAPPPKIILDLDEHGGLRDSEEQQGAFTVPRRDDGYYFTAAMAPERALQRKRDFADAAVSAADVRWWLGIRYSGWEVCWRVRHLRVGNGEMRAVESVETEKTVATAVPLAAGLKADRRVEIALGENARIRKKGKPGKKRRIILRVKKRKIEEAAKRRQEETERKLKNDQEREDAERAKRTRRNREKKVKKKMKEKEKKALVRNDAIDTTQ